MPFDPWPPRLTIRLSHYLFAMYFHIFTCFRNVSSLVFPIKMPAENKPGKSDVVELSKLLGLIKLNKDLALPSHQLSVLVTVFVVVVVCLFVLWSTQILELKVLKEN